MSGAVLNESRAALVMTLLSLALGGSGCSQKTTELPVLGPVTSVVVSDHHGAVLRTIDDPMTVSTIVAFVDSHQRGWGIPWHGVPSSTVVANFYDEQQFKGHFGAGEGFFESQRIGGFYAKPASDDERNAFLGLLQVAGQPE
jgi:hypothetical protein